MTVFDEAHVKWWRRLPAETQRVLYEAAREDRMDGQVAKTIIDSPSPPSHPSFVQFDGSYEGSWFWPVDVREMIVSEGVRQE